MLDGICTCSDHVEMHTHPNGGLGQPIDMEADDFELPTPGRERLHGRFDGIPPQAATQRNIANRRRVIE